MPEINITIPGVPIAQHRPRFARRGKFVTAYSDQQTEAGKFLLLAQSQIPEKIPAGVPISLSCLFYFPIPASTTKRRIAQIDGGDDAHIKKPDVSNLVKFVEDCLNGIAWHDDSQIYQVKARKIYSHDPRTSLYISWDFRSVNNRQGGEGQGGVGLARRLR